MSTKKPHRPYTTEGTAASRSTRTESGPRMRRGASSVMYSAVATAIGTPISSAIAAVTSVPTSIGRAEREVAAGRTGAALLEMTCPSRCRRGS